MSNEHLKKIGQITAKEFRDALHIRIYPMVEDFVVARIGRIHYAVSMAYGYSYTRQELINKYENISATYLITRKTAVTP